MADSSCNQNAYLLPSDQCVSAARDPLSSPRPCERRRLEKEWWSRQRIGQWGVWAKSENVGKECILWAKVHFRWAKKFKSFHAAEVTFNFHLELEKRSFLLATLLDKNHHHHHHDQIATH